jgi:hypothetical protein
MTKLYKQISITLGKYNHKIVFKKIKNSKYKYELLNTYGFYSGIKNHVIYHKYYTLYADGYVEAKPGYRWDGATGALDTDSVMRASLGHDILTQLYHDGMLEAKHIPIFNDLFEQHCKEDFMSKWQRSLYRGLIKLWWRKRRGGK